MLRTFACAFHPGCGVYSRAAFINILALKCGVYSGKYGICYKHTKIGNVHGVIEFVGMGRRKNREGFSRNEFTC